MLGSLELEIQMFVNHHVGAGDQTQFSTRVVRAPRTTGLSPQSTGSNVILLVSG